MLYPKGTLLFFLETGSFYNSPRVKQLSFTVFESLQPISGSGGSTFSLAYHRSLNRITFTFMHLADAFIQSDLQCIQAIHFLWVWVWIRPLASRSNMNKEFRYFSHLKLDSSVVALCTEPTENKKLWFSRPIWLGTIHLFRHNNQGFCCRTMGPAGAYIIYHMLYHN